jgi:UDP-N-acetylmuramoylalanine--D-glutamate ligase
LSMTAVVTEESLEVSGKKAVVLGLARQGTALARYLVAKGADVTVSDLRSEGELADRLGELEPLPIRYELGGHPASLLEGADLLCLSGGVPFDVAIAVEARKKGIRVTNDAELFLERCPAPVIGITGSAGKTTTTAITGEMCREAGLRTWVGGNIGNPLIADLEEIEAGDWVVMELSSFQLEVMNLSPHVAAVLNVTPNHLDRHGDMETYLAAKRSIVAHQTSDDYAVLGYDDANARALALDTPAHLLWFSDRAEVEEGAFATNGDLTLRRIEGGEEVDSTICSRDEIQLRGRHNVLNVLAAAALASLAGAPVEAIGRVARSFTGVEHRLELVRDVRGVRWFDDSIATTPERALAALRSFEEPIVLLAGGRDKKLPWDEFAAEAVRRVRQLVTFGEAGGMIARVATESLAAHGEEGRTLEAITETETLEEAVDAAAKVAAPGDVVLLSPGGTSYDAFVDFAARGDAFKELVGAL